MGKLNRKLKFLIGFFVALFLFASVNTFAQTEPDLAKIFADSKDSKGKRPIIFIPGILGSELVNEETGEKVWFSLKRSKVDDLRLPIALDLMLSGDSLVPKDIVRKLDLPIINDVDIYQKIVDSLKNYGGYTEVSWDEPPKKLEDTFFVFPYDWRRDNVETAHALIEKIEALKKKTKRPNLKFNILAHSMGGLVTRYAEMYGKKDLPKGNNSPKPNWYGRKHFNRVFMFGTPNEGAADALKIILEGYGIIQGINLPFIQDLKPIEVITMPSIFQLLPHRNTYRFFDENLKSIKIDIYNIKTWEKYGWSIFGKGDLLKDFTAAEIGRVEAYVEIVLKRAKKFHRAIDIKSKSGNDFKYYLIGSDCTSTLDGFVVYKDLKLGRWVTLTKPKSFKTSKGVKIHPEAVRQAMLSPGDGRVTRRSLFASTFSGKHIKKSSRTFPIENSFMVCEAHDSLTGNKSIQNHVLTSLLSEQVK